MMCFGMFFAGALFGGTLGFLFCAIVTMGKDAHLNVED